MKKIILLTVSILMVTVVFGQTPNGSSQMPIPSYNVPVTGRALFVGNTTNINNNQALIAEKRDMNVSNEGGGNGPVGGTMTVYITRVDQSIVLGPYSIGAGQTISVPIENSPWDVIMVTSQTTLVNVWIDNGYSL